MRRVVSVVAVVVTVVASAGHTQQLEPPSQVSPQELLQIDNESTGRWFVELASAPASDGTSAAALEAEEGRFHAAAGAANVSYQEQRHFRRLWNGLAVSASDGEAAKLKLLPGVVAVYPVLDVAVQRQDTPVISPELATALAQTGANVAQSAFGLTGAGVRVAVMDTGIDYDHPDLGGCFGPGCRVERGFDLVGDAYNSSSPTSVRAPDPLPDDCAGHGTHVAGIIGANGLLKGVAPGVTFHAYRVFGCEGTTATDVMLEAMERVVADGADVLNMSIGISYQWPQYPVSQAADRLIKEGVVVVASIGNSGATGLYSASAPGVGKRVIGVASFDNTHENLPAISLSPDGRLSGYRIGGGAPLPPSSGTFLMARTGTTTSADDACNGAAAPAPGSLTGRYALIRRGTCGFYEKAFNAQTAGAIGVVLYNNAAGRLGFTVAGTPPVTIPVIMVTAADGAVIDARIAGGPTTMSFTTALVAEAQPTGNLISAFSSFGVAPDLSLKPDLGAPGGNIRSTIPLEQGAYGPNSGTSMASPHVAGAVALLLQARPDLDPGSVLGLLQSTAKPKPWFGNPTLGFLDNVHRQGGGMLDVVAAVRVSAQAFPSALSLGEFESGSVTRQITLRDVASSFAINTLPKNSPVRYTLGHEPALATGANTFVPSFLASFATVTFATPTVDLLGKTTFEVTITPPANANARLFGGYITLTPNNGGEVIRIPYSGYNGDYQAIPTLVPTANGFPWLARLSGTTFTRLPTGGTFTMQGEDVPFLLYHFDHAVDRLLLEVIDVSKARGVGLVGKERYIGRNSTATSFFAGAWDGTLGGQPVPNGTYQLRIHVLKALGDKNNPAHSEIWTSPDITIMRPTTTP
jgi:subtilisin family serine protease